MMPHTSYASVSSGHCQYPAQKSMDANYLLSLKSASSASIIGIGYRLALAASLTGRISILVRSRDLEYLETRCSAACHDA